VPASTKPFLYFFMFYKGVAPTERIFFKTFYSLQRCGFYEAFSVFFHCSTKVSLLWSEFFSKRFILYKGAGFYEAFSVFFHCSTKVSLLRSDLFDVFSTRCGFYEANLCSDSYCSVGATPL